MAETADSPPVPEVSYETVDFAGVPIWSTGTFNGDEYTVKDLDSMVQAQNALGDTLKPYLKLGHDESQKLVQKDGYPAAGWITNLKRIGQTLYADIKNVPKVIAELIQNKAYGRFSPEIYWNLKEGGHTYRRVLKALALLGADTPANGTIQDFISLYAAEYDDLKTYSTLEDNTMEQEQLKAYVDEIAALKSYKEQAEKKLAEAAETEKKYAAKVREHMVKEYSAKVETMIIDAKDKLTPAAEKPFRELASFCVGYAAAPTDQQGTPGTPPAETPPTPEEAAQALKLLQAFLSAMPKMNVTDAPVTQYTEAPVGTTAESDDEILARKAKEYAQANKVKYAEALRIVSKEGK